MKKTAMVAAAIVLMAGCSQAPTTLAAPTPTATPTPTAEVGQAAPEALRGFSCETDAAGVWNATGHVVNRADGPHTYEVAVVVGASDGQPMTARRTSLELQPKATAPFELKKIPVSSPDGPCQIRVLVVD